MGLPRLTCTIRKLITLMNILIVLSVVFISSCEGFCLRTIGRSLMFGKITKQRHNIRSVSGLASSSEFKGRSGDKNIPDAGRISSNKGTIAKSLSVGTIEQGGYFCSFEMYACQKQTQRLVGSHLANWARAEIYCLRDCGTFSMILHSICGRRVVHVIGWKIEGNLLSKNFEDMKKRGEAPGTTGGMTRFDTEETETYPLFSIDLFNCQQMSRQAELVTHLEKAVLSSFPSTGSTKIKKENSEDIQHEKRNENESIESNDIGGNDKTDNDNNSSRDRSIEVDKDSKEGVVREGERGGEGEVELDVKRKVIDRLTNIPELQAMHLLRSTDKLCCIILAAWSDVTAYSQLSEIKKYNENIKKAKSLSIEGSYSDIIEKTTPNRLYYVFDVLLPNSLENPLLDYSKMF